MKATENLDTVYLTTLLGELSQIRELLPSGGNFLMSEQVIEARIRLHQLSVRISKDVLDMSKQEADESEMPLGPIAARAHRIEDEVAY